jgi:hypothetical protein
MGVPHQKQGEIYEHVQQVLAYFYHCKKCGFSIISVHELKLSAESEDLHLTGGFGFRHNRL